MKDAPVPNPLVIDVAMPCAAWRKHVPGIAKLVRETVQAALADAAFGDTEISLMLSDDASVRALNKRWRGKDAPTNVLSFATGEARMLGDVVLAFETVAREAKEQRKPLAHHVRHLIVHGVLHLLGHDHERERDATRMENRERRILQELGISDPYQLSPSPLEGEGRNRARKRPISGGGYDCTARVASPPSLTLPLKGGGEKIYSGRKSARHG